MTISKDILTTLKAYHFDNPEATWDELRERLIDIAESCLTMAHGDSSLIAYEMINDEHHQALREASAKMPLSVSQQRAIGKALEIIEASQERLTGRPGKLVGIVEDLKGEACGTSVAPSLSLSVRPSKGALTWDFLSSQYMAEHSVNIKPTTKGSMEANYRVIKAAFEETGLTDLRTHNRDQMVAIRTALLEGRQPSTVNNLLTKMMTVLDWAVNNDYLAKAYTSNLKLTKGTDSKREGFTKAQVITLMEHSATMPTTSWERWGLSLLAITGARVGEIAYLTKEDIKQVDGLWCIHINEDGPNKSIKNKHSDRMVPLIDGAFGVFDLQGFLKAVDDGALPSEHGATPGQASRYLGRIIKKALGASLENTQTLHSLRHHLSSALQAEGIPVAYAQAITGHSSRTVTFGTYGDSIPVGKLSEALMRVLTE